jgi:hypothetical protein
MHKLILGLIYYCLITPICFGPLIEVIIRESNILECYKAFMAFHSHHTRREYIHITTFKQIAIKAL